MPKNRITEIREARGLSVAELAARAKFSGPYVSQMANGTRNISLKNLERLATALGCRPEDLLAAPTPTNTDILNVWSAIPVHNRDLALQVLQSFTNSETNTNESAIVDTRGSKKRKPGNLK